MTDSGRQHSIPLDILDDLASRFIINAPECEKSDLIRMCFQIELAHWFYIDEYVAANNMKTNIKGGSRLRSCTIREFAEHMFRHVSFLRGYTDSLDEIMDDWKRYKLAVPTYGAIILNEDCSKVLLAQGFWSKTSWGFPKGKVNQDEEPHLCAVREVLEETGFDISGIIDPEQYLETVISDQINRLYLIPGVLNSTVFQPKTKNEIRDLRWFNVSDLPSSKKELNKGQQTLNANNFYMVMPFVKSLRKWIHKLHNDQLKRVTRHRNKKRSVSQDKQQEALDFYSPACWTKFHFNRKDILNAITSTPGWTSK